MPRKTEVLGYQVPLQENLTDHCIPPNMDTIDIEGYDAFLPNRRELMATKIQNYYRTL